MDRQHFEPADAYAALARAFEILDSFQGCARAAVVAPTALPSLTPSPALSRPPFTVQRLCELAIAPRKHYSTLPKYFRALTRVISVTSDRSTFTEDDSIDFAITTVSPSDSHLAHSSVILAGSIIPTRRPAAGRSPMSSPRAVPVVVPLLSPIPWLVVSNDDLESVDPMELHSPTASGSKPRSPPSTRRAAPPKTDLAVPQSSTSTPTGGLVDEVDPGSGTQETAAPLGLTVAGALSALAKDAGSGGALEPTTTLADRFVRASSPRVDRGPPEDDEGGPDGVGAGGEDGVGATMEAEA